MTEAELANAEYWAHFWDTIEYWAFFGVFVTLGLEFFATKFAAPHKSAIEHAQKVALEDRKNENLQLSLKLEAERKERLELESSLAPRRLPDRVVGPLTEKLKRIAKPKAIAIVSVMADPEAQEFANQYIKLFREADWDVSVSQAQFVESHRGSIITFDPETVDRRLLDEMLGAFNESGHPAEPVAIPNMHGGIRLTIFHKP